MDTTEVGLPKDKEHTNPLAKVRGRGRDAVAVQPPDEGGVAGRVFQGVENGVLSCGEFVRCQLHAQGRFTGGVGRAPGFRQGTSGRTSSPRIVGPPPHSRRADLDPTVLAGSGSLRWDGRTAAADAAPVGRQTLVVEVEPVYTVGNGNHPVRKPNHG